MSEKYNYFESFINKKIFKLSSEELEQLMVVLRENNISKNKYEKAIEKTCEYKKNKLNKIYNEIIEINIFFDFQLMFIGSFIDHLAIGDDFGDIDIILEEDFFYKKLNINKYESFKKNKIKLEYKHMSESPFRHSNKNLYQGYFKSLPIDIFLIKNTTSNIEIPKNSVCDEIGWTIIDDYNILDFFGSKLKISKVAQRIKVAKKLISLKESDFSIDGHKKWAINKKYKCEKKIKLYKIEYPEYFTNGELYD